jgi:hypothetical protein
MGLRDLKNNLSVAESIVPATKTATAYGAGVDLQGAKSAMAAFSAGAKTGAWTPAIQESDVGDTSPDTYTDVAAGDIEGTIAALSASAVAKYGYKGLKRYIRLGVTTADSPASLVIAANVITEPLAKPAA